MNTEAFPDPSGREDAIVVVDANMMRELSDTYTLYRQALAEPGDPVRVLMMTGEIVAAVRRIATDPGWGVRK